MRRLRRIALAALVATWSQNLAYRDEGLSLLTTFVQETRVNPASRSITADILLFFLAATIFMVIEARKHDIKFVWPYIIGGMLIAISVTFPLFLIAREMRLSASDTPQLPVLDKVLLGAFAVVAAVAVVWVDLG